VTRIDPLAKFYPAEAYHQDYALIHPNNPYIAYNDLPKVDNLKRVFSDVYREQPVTVASMAAKP
jgi:peptide-methionine (S)-S-oxide reductase